MNRLFRSCVLVLCAGVISFLSATAQTAPTGGGPPGGGPGGGPGGAQPPYIPKNLKVLPDDTDLRKVMRGFAGDLGVECEFCHTAPDPVTKRPDRLGEVVCHRPSGLAKNNVVCCDA